MCDALVELSDLIHPYLGNSTAGDDFRRLFDPFLPALGSAIQRITSANISIDQGTAKSTSSVIGGPRLFSHLVMSNLLGKISEFHRIGELVRWV